MSENLRTYTKALYSFDAVVSRAPADSWSNPSPCEGWTAGDVMAHLIGMNDMVAGFCEGTNARGPAHDIPAEPLTQWSESRDGLLNALDRKGALQSVAKTPWGEMPVDKFLGFSWVDPIVHAWDLAKATGQPAVVDEELAARGAAQLAKAGDSIRGEQTFAAAVDLGKDASPVDQLAAIAGRNPAA